MNPGGLHVLIAFVFHKYDKWLKYQSMFPGYLSDGDHTLHSECSIPEPRDNIG